MRAYLIKRTLLILPTLIGITLVTFVITRFVPGGPIEQALFEAQFNHPPETRAATFPVPPGRDSTKKTWLTCESTTASTNPF